MDKQRGDLPIPRLTHLTPSSALGSLMQISFGQQQLRPQSSWGLHCGNSGAKVGSAAGAGAAVAEIAKRRTLRRRVFACILKLVGGISVIMRLENWMIFDVVGF